jgi:hypothetical protein
MTQSQIAQTIFFLVGGILAFGIVYLLKRFVGPLLCDVQLGESGIMLVILSFIRFRIIPYRDIVSIREMTKRNFGRKRYAKD